MIFQDWILRLLILHLMQRAKFHKIALGIQLLDVILTACIALQNICVFVLVTINALRMWASKHEGKISILYFVKTTHIL